MDIKSAFGEVLREQRKEANVSQEQLALRAELDRTFVSKLERGLNQPSLETVFTVSKVLGCSPSSLIQRVEQKLD